mmetsp:Transcript_12423/g.39605  ORF Transcript_12423/g.39605 Transcript_12423/m.39605 type:complete len:233 (-) Transcript_12423:184-882(-)
MGLRRRDDCALLRAAPHLDHHLLHLHRRRQERRCPALALGLLRGPDCRRPRRRHARRRHQRRGAARRRHRGGSRDGVLRAQHLRVPAARVGRRRRLEAAPDRRGSHGVRALPDIRHLLPPRVALGRAVHRRPGDGTALALRLGRAALHSARHPRRAAVVVAFPLSAASLMAQRCGEAAPPAPPFALVFICRLWRRRLRPPRRAAKGVTFVSESLHVRASSARHSITLECETF